MNSRELMIGDWVLINGIPRQVSQITKHKIGYHRTELPFGECKMSYARLSEVSPIPITPEILEKNGWKKYRIEKHKWEDWLMDSGLDNYYKDTTVVFNEKYRITVNVQKFDGGKRLRFSTHTPVAQVRSYYFNYVHELQNALRLCGLNELADNFKV